MEKLTNEYFIDAYLEEVGKRSPGSFANNRLLIQKFIESIQKPFLDITMIDIQHYLINVIDKNKIKKSTKNSRRYMLKAFFNFIKKTMLLYNVEFNNPIPSKKIFKFTTNLDDIAYVTDPELEILNQGQIKKIVDYAKNNIEMRDFILIGLTIFCGGRISEIRTIMIKNVNFQGCYFQTGFIPGSRKTTLHTNRGLLFFFPKAFRPYLQKYIKSCNKCEEWLFPGYKNNALSRSTTQDIISKLRDILGFHFTWHTFRRTRITEMKKMGCPLDVSEMLLNHSPTSVEARSYIKLSIKEKQKLYNRWNPYKKLNLLQIIR